MPETPTVSALSVIITDKRVLEISSNQSKVMVLWFVRCRGATGGECPTCPRKAGCDALVEHYWPYGIPDWKV